MENQVLEAIRKRRSFRKYQSRQVDDGLLQAVLEAGTYAPTAKGMQNAFIVAVQDKEMREQIVRMNAEVMGTDQDPYYGAPTLVLVFSNPEMKNWIQDGSLVLGNMMLAAHAVGLASCWINREIEMFQTEEGKELMKRMGLPEGLSGVGALALGYADMPTPEPKPRKKDYFRIIK